MPFFFRNQVVRGRRDGRFDLVLDPRMRETADGLLGELDALLEDPDDPSLRRLSPPAYPDDADQQSAYELLAGEELRTSRREAIATSRTALGKEVLEADELWSWLRSLNALRLVVGTRLGIEEDIHDIDRDPDSPDAPLWAIYEFTTWLQASVIEALRS